MSSPDTGSTLLFRADASPEIGTGHVMRCLSLAEQAKRYGFRGTFLLVECPGSLQDRIEAAGMEAKRVQTIIGSPDDARLTAEEAVKLEARWVIADGYLFDAAWQKTVKTSSRLLVFDDYGHSIHYYADIVLNQNLHAASQSYASREPFTHLLLGPRYVQLRSQFLQWQPWHRDVPAAARKVLITFGGADKNDMTSRALRAMTQVPNLSVTVLVGASHPRRDKLRAVISDLPDSYRLEIDSNDMPSLMAWADLAIAAAGTTAWELAFMGLPAVVLTLADNQIEVAASLNEAGICDSLTAQGEIATQTITDNVTSLMLDQPRRERMSRLGRHLVDGLGCERVLARIRAADIHLHAARDEDSHTVWGWANDSETRAMSFNSKSIAWEDHLQWYRSKLENPRCFFYIATDEQGLPIGQIRFDLDGPRAVISVGLAFEARGRSLGSPVVIRALDELYTKADVTAVHAYVKPINQASIRTFLKADFDELEMTQVQGGEAKHFVYSRKTQ